jgi:hypothetical protein
MTKDHFRRALDDLDLTQPAAAELLGLCLRTVNGYANGKPIPAPVEIVVTAAPSSGRHTVSSRLARGCPTSMNTASRSKRI